MDPAMQTAVLGADEARQRFDWARRHGHPLWLWPNVGVAPWQAALDDIESVLRDILTDRSTEARLDGEADAVGLACYTSGVGPLLGYWSETGRLKVEPDMQVVLASHLGQNRSRMAMLTARAGELAGALAAARIRAILLKGMHTAHVYFPDPAARPMSDIDLLVGEGDGSIIGRILSSLGYVWEAATVASPEGTWRMSGTSRLPHTLDLVHGDDPWTIDVHLALEKTFGSRRIRLDRPGRRLETEPWPLFPQTEMLGQPLLLLHLATHASCTFTSLTLIRLVELTLVIRRDFSGRPESWEKVMSVATELGASGMAYPALRMCEELVPGTVPGEVLEAFGRQAPVAVTRVLDSISPASAHRLLRYSMRERFMWARDWNDVFRELARDLVVPGLPLADAAKLYRTRFWLLVRGMLTR